MSAYHSGFIFAVVSRIAAADSGYYILFVGGCRMDDIGCAVIAYVEQ
jgi:hypothetical protein